MTTPQPTVGRYPLLETLLSEKSFSFKGLYTNCDAATIFAVSSRTIQQWVRDGKLHARNLPGRGRFLRRTSKTSYRIAVVVTTEAAVVSPAELFRPPRHFCLSLSWMSSVSSTAATHLSSL